MHGNTQLESTTMKKRTEEINTSKDVIENYNEKVDELYRPFLIHPTTYVILTEQILTLMPKERNIILSMNEYDLNEINPAHPNDADAPTHVIIFCIRFVADDMFQPIGGLMIYKYKNQSVLLAECVKAYINDLWKLGLYVVATVSPPFETFKKILSHLVKVENFDNHSGVISYSVSPIKHIVHVYDVQFLLIKLQNMLREGDVRFEEENRADLRVYRATWKDISVVMNVSAEYKFLDDYLSKNKEAPRRVHIFTHQIYEQLVDAEARGLLSCHASGSVVLLNCIRAFVKFTEEDVVDVNAAMKSEDWEPLIDLFKSMTFQKSKGRTCTKNKHRNLHGKHDLDKPSTKRRIDFKQEVDGLSKSLEEKLVVNEKESYSKIKGKKSKKKKLGCKTGALANGTLTEEKSDSGLPGLPVVAGNSLSIDGSDDISNSVIPLDRVTHRADETDCTDSLDSISRRESQADKNCDIDKNNNSDESIQSGEKNIPRIKVRKNPRKRKRAKEPVFDVVINDPHEFFQSMSECKSSSTPPGFLEIYDKLDQSKQSCGVTANGSAGPNDSTDNAFWSISDEETENDISASCDKVPNILQLLKDIEDKDDFESNSVSCEFLCTVNGTRKLLAILEERRVRVAKPDAFVVEHIDFLVTTIKRVKNNMNNVPYYGHNYKFLNSELAFATLNNDKGLYLVAKE